MGVAAPPVSRPNGHFCSDKVKTTERRLGGNQLDSAKTIEDGGDFLDLRHVNVARGDRVVLHDVNLTIRAGEHVAILGPNGCGKSTLILAMTCQIYPIVQPGMVVRIFGRERWDLTQLRRHFGVVGAGLMGAELPGERGFGRRTAALSAGVQGAHDVAARHHADHVGDGYRPRAA